MPHSPSHSINTFSLSARVLVQICLIVLIANCSSFNQPDSWSYRYPPKPDQTVPDDNSLIWCSTEQGAQFMSITGWFSPDCTKGRPDQGSADCRVSEVVQKTIGMTSMKLVNCTNGIKHFWLPLPDHDWI